MLPSVQQTIEADGAEANRVRTMRGQWAQTVTPDHADRLGKAANGSYYTNPELTAQLGLSDLPVDVQAVHRNSQQQMIKSHAIAEGRPQLVRGADPQPVAPPLDRSLMDLLRMSPTDFATRPTEQPAWWDQVDPGGLWRGLQVPEIKNAKEMLNLNEAQVVKLFASKTPTEWDAIPGMVGKDTFDMKGNRIPGSFDPFRDLGAKFPSLKELWTARNEINNPSLSGTERALGTIQNDVTTTLKGLGAVLSSPFDALSFFVPDRVGVQTGGMNIPIKSIGEPVAATLRGATKVVTTGFMSAAQLIKSTIEFQMTHPGDASGLMIAPPAVGSQGWHDYKKLVLEGNILTQIAKRVIDPNKNIDVGGGFFPEGQAKIDALTAHDAGLPQLGGHTWNVGNALIEPLIKEGYIDRDSYAASVISGIADAVFTVGTDPAVYVDPVKVLMKFANLSHVAATALASPRYTEIIGEGWAAERAAAGLSTTPKVLPVIEGYLADEVPRFAGMLPTGTVIPAEVDDALKALAKDATAGKSLVSMDAPPTLALPDSFDALAARRRSLGVIDQADGTKLLEPAKIDEMPYTILGRQALRKLAGSTNAGELWDTFLGNVPIGAAYQIQLVVDAAKAAGKEVNLADVHKVLREAVFSGDPLYNIRETPGIIKQAIQQTGTQIAKWAAGGTRQLATMPGSTFFSFGDPIASIKDMNRMLIIMKVPTVERHAMLSKAIKAVVADGAGARFELANEWMSTMVGPTLRETGMPEDWIRKVTKWAGWSDGIQKWTMDALGEGYKLASMGDGEMIRIVDALNQGFLMVHPDNLQTVIRETTNLWKVFEPFRGNPVMEALLRPTLQNHLLKIQNMYLKPVALGAPLPVRMVTKILPDEITRIAATGDFSLASLQALGITGHLNYDTAGKIILSGKEVNKLVPIVEELDRLYRVVASDPAKYQPLIDKLEKKFGTRKELKTQIKTFEARQDIALPGTLRNLAETSQGLSAEARADPAFARLERSRIVENQTKDVGENGLVINPDSPQNQRWVTGTARDIIRMSSSPEYVLVAKTLLADGAAGVALLPERLFRGDLRDVFDYALSRLGKQNPLRPLDSLEGVHEWVGTVVADILTRTAKDPVGIGVVATGEFGGKSARTEALWHTQARGASFNVHDPSPEFSAWVKDNLLSNPDSTKVAPFHRTQASEEVATKERLFTKAFSLYRDASAKYARTPFGDYSKWKRIIELIPAMSPKEARLMLARLDKADAPEWLRDSIRAEIPRAAGKATRKQVEILGVMHGADRVDDVLYDFSKKSYFGSRHSLLFGFFDAWMEQWSVWARLMFEHPSNLEKARLAKEGMTNAEVPSWAGGQPGRGVLYTDPDSGQQAIAVPFTREIYQMLGLNAQEQINTKGLTMLGSAVPGFFGVGAIIFDSLIPKMQAFMDARQVAFPFGDPQARSKLADYLVPAWGQALATSLIPHIAGGGTTDLATNLQAIFATEQNDSIRATTLNAVLTNIASNSGDRPRNNADRTQLLNDTLNKTDFLLGLKAVMRIFLPTVSMTRYYTDIGSDNVTQGTVMDDLRAITDKAPTYAEGITAFLEKYGEDAWIYLAGGTNALPGMQATKEFAAWQLKNNGLLEKYPLVGGYLGPQDGDYSPNAYGAQRALGNRTPRQIEERQDAALNNLAWSIFNTKKDSLLKEGLAAGLTAKQTLTTSKYKDTMKAQSELLKKNYPSWNPAATSGERERELSNQMVQIEAMVTDKKVLAQPAGQALKEYWDYRVRNVANVVAAFPEFGNDSWRNAVRAAPLRAGLISKGEYLVSQFPEFSALWENVLSREFTPAEIAQ
jgi:hypothetical protein